MRWLYRLPGGPALLGPAPPHAGVPLPARGGRPQAVGAAVDLCAGRRVRRSALWRIGTVLRQVRRFPWRRHCGGAGSSLFAVPFVLLVRVIDYLEREPLGLQVLAILWGGVVATSAALSGGTRCRTSWPRCSRPARRCQMGTGRDGRGGRGAGQGRGRRRDRAGGTTSDQQRGRRLCLRRPGRAGLPVGRGHGVRAQRRRARRRRRCDRAGDRLHSSCAGFSAACGATPCSLRSPEPGLPTPSRVAATQRGSGSAVALAAVRPRRRVPFSLELAVSCRRAADWASSVSSWSCS